MKSEVVVRAVSTSRASDPFREDVLAGLSASPKRLPCKYLYDARGSELFDRITELKAYYPTTTELGILEDRAHAIAKAVGPGVRVVEYGSGSSNKTRILLDALRSPAEYVPIDISVSCLADAAARIAHEYPGLAVTPLHADYTDRIELPPGPRTLAYFPGSTIGNFEPEEAVAFLSRVRRTVGKGLLLIGVDLKKDPAVLHEAYNDPEGVTALFNLNLLARINRELGASFDLPRFRHYAPYNPELGCIEMHLVSAEAQVVTIGDYPISFGEGESILTERSYKYGIAEFGRLAESAGFTVARVWTDPRRLFSVQLLAGA
jgi:dimethylhistidine N-methyltransferase